MSEDFKELNTIMSLDNPEVSEAKEEYEKDLSVLLSRVKSYHINDLDFSSYYDVDNDFEKYKLDEVFVNYNLNKDTLEFKISLLQNYLNELFVEKKFNDYRRDKEEHMEKNEYLEYVHNPSVKADKLSEWYQEFLNK